MTTSEKVAYLKGLADGLGLGKETKEEKLIAAIIDTLESIAADIEDLDEITLDLGEELDAVSDDLANLESLVYDDYDDDCCCDDDCCDDHDDCCCGHDHHHHEHRDSCCGHDRHQHGSCCHGNHGVMYEVTCPACDNTITIDEEVLNLGSILCPSCGGTLEFDFEGGEEKHDCSCEDK